MDNLVVPIWLPGFLELANEDHKDRYFTMCKEHGAIDEKEKRKGQKNHYCADCKTGPLCSKGSKVYHDGHKVLQVRRESYKDVVNVSDISTLFNIDHIQRFFINGKEVVFLQSRPQAKPAQGSPNHCEVCGRSLAAKIARFCSLSCKVKVIAGHFGGNSPPEPMKQTTRPFFEKEKDIPAIQTKRPRSYVKKGREKVAPALQNKNLIAKSPLKKNREKDPEKKRAMEEKKDGEKNAHCLDLWEDREKEAASTLLLFASTMLRELARSSTSQDPPLETMGECAGSITSQKPALETKGEYAGPSTPQNPP